VRLPASAVHDAGDRGAVWSAQQAQAPGPVSSSLAFAEDWRPGRAPPSNVLWMQIAPYGCAHPYAWTCKTPLTLPAQQRAGTTQTPQRPIGAGGGEKSRAG
jgi:hypothetical protein